MALNSHFLAHINLGTGQQGWLTGTVKPQGPVLGYLCLTGPYPHPKWFLHLTLVYCTALDTYLLQCTQGQSSIPQRVIKQQNKLDLDTYTLKPVRQKGRPGSSIL